jgi:hypothetical protein
MKTKTGTPAKKSRTPRAAKPPEFPRRLFVERRHKDGEASDLIGHEDLEDIDGDISDCMRVAVYELVSVGEALTARHVEFAPDDDSPIIAACSAALFEALEQRPRRAPGQSRPHQLERIAKEVGLIEPKRTPPASEGDQ